MPTLIFITIIIAAVVMFYLMNSSQKTNEQSQRDTAGSNPAEEIDWQAEIEQLAQKTQLFIQAGIVGDQNVIGAINAGTYRGPYPEKRSDGGWLSVYDNLRILKIAGINHRKGIDAYIGRLDVALVPEPENEFDPNAIKIVAEDRHHLGYIPSDQTDLVRSMTANEFPYRCTAIIEQCEDEDDGHKFFVGFVYIKRLD